MRTLNPLSALRSCSGPTTCHSYEAITDEDRFEFDLIRVESQHMASYARPLVAALHEIPNRFGPLPTNDVAAFLDQWPGLRRSALISVVSALQRFWTGDAQGSCYVLLPRIERLVRELILSVDHGMYLLQRVHSPGHFPGLGGMLSLLPGRFDISESRVRFLRALLTEPAGFNLRNHLAHGTHDYSDPGVAALLIHAALHIAMLRPAEQMNPT
jgi:Domain of unknown function (DUF4209)